MSILIAGILVIVSFLLGATLMFGAFLTTSVTQGDSLRDLARSGQVRVGAAISISDAVASDSGGGTDMTVVVDNTGSSSVVNFEQMDVIVNYTDPDDNEVLRYLDFVASGPGDNQWTNPATGITPDTFNPRIWDPDESFTIELRVTPGVKSGTSALVVVATPQGARDRTLVGN